MKSIRVLLCTAALALVSGAAIAQSDFSKSISQLGVQVQPANAPSLAYFSVNGGFTLSCAYGLVYLDITTDFGRAAYAELLAAKNAGQQLSRIDYTQSGGANSMCTLQLVEVEN